MLAKRRNTLKRISAIAAIPLALPSFAFAQSKKEEEPPKPYREIAKKIPQDRKRVKVFFQYTCSYCAHYFSGIDGWGRTLPPGWKFEWVPVIVSTSKEEFISAMAYYAVMQIAPSKLSLFFARLRCDYYAKKGCCGSQHVAWRLRCRQDFHPRV